MPPKIALLKLLTPPSLVKVYEKKFVFQDMLVPVKTLTKSLDAFDQEFNIYPLWLCPYRQYKAPGGRKTFVSPGEQVPGGGYEMYVDIGAYGMPPKDVFDAKRAVRRIEEFVRENRGFQMLYADTYMTESEFKAMFDHTLYEKMRDKYNAHGAFPTVFQKVRKR